ncbi:MAG TPA: hypothetical protein VG939_02905 [Caulobacteraceae bacterium]|nr:hypothetical protein [Caulobacteraceae bacterium]
MIIAIEGAPGVGKSTTSAALGARGAQVIPEVNLLFGKAEGQLREWYYDRQVARWEMARLISRDRLAVLDGDLYQPLWFAWIYAAEGWPANAWAFDFYRRRIARGQMGFPDLYVLAHVAEATRRERMMAREMAHGRSEAAALAKTDRYARMVEPQRRFFAALGARFPGWVVEIETDRLETAVAAIQDAAGTAPPVAPAEALDFIEHWLGAHPARTDPPL